jgi:hypothetical protein
MAGNVNSACKRYYDERRIRAVKHGTLTSEEGDYRYYLIDGQPCQVHRRLWHFDGRLDRGQTDKIDIVGNGRAT